ncbi:MAG: L-2-hydroxyglutarate oxidase, partial [Cyanobacteriota bacterium]
RQVCRKYAELFQKRGGEIQLGQKVVEIEKSAVGYRLTTEKERFETRFLINCGGLQSDRLAKLAGSAPPAKIVPFRGEYYELKPEKRHLVKSLIYPVPNPDFPFLGVHFTRMIDGSVHAGPNAVLSFKREGYSKWDFDWRDFSDAVAYPGLWKLAQKHWDEGLKEIWRSLSQAAFVQSLQQLIPSVTAEDLIPTPPGIRAQALRPDGALVDDFLILDGAATLQVCNAPSPAATASLEIGRAIAERIP